MAGRVIEITRDGLALHLERGFLAVRENGALAGRIPLDEIDGVLLSCQSAMISNRAVAALAAAGAPVVFVGPDYNPVCLLLPLAGTQDQGFRIEAQAAASKPMSKRLWAAIVRQKIRSQAEVLKRTGATFVDLARLADRVRSGDPDNLEAQAAALYWPRLFGRDFVRSDDRHPANPFLNYGYTVLRSATARAIVAAGLSPSLAIHHRSGGNPLRLSDDLMEPFRPAVDLIVSDLVKEGRRIIDPSTKRRLAAVLTADYATANGRSPLSVVLVSVCQSLERVYRKTERALVFPVSRLPISTEDVGE